MRTWKSVALALAVATTVSAYADDRTSTTGTTTGASGTMSDHTHSNGTPSAMRNDPALQNLTTEKFFNTAAAAGMKEVQAAELALHNSTNEQVKSFARQMISDHTKQNSQLTTLAAQNNVPVPKDLPSKEKADIEKLRAATGTTFDTAYAQQMKMDHEKAIALFQGCANGNQIKNDVRKFCRDSLATLEEHSQAASNLDTRPNATRAASTDE